MCCLQERIARNGNTIRPTGQEKRNRPRLATKTLQQRLNGITNGKKKFAVIALLEERKVAEARMKTRTRLEEEFQKRKSKPRLH